MSRCEYIRSCPYTGSIGRVCTPRNSQSAEQAIQACAEKLSREMLNAPHEKRIKIPDGLLTKSIHIVLD